MPYFARYPGLFYKILRNDKSFQIRARYSILLPPVGSKNSSNSNIFTTKSIISSNKIIKKSAKPGYALSCRSVESFAFYKHSLLYTSSNKKAKKKKSYAILFLCARRIATHFPSQYYSISLF